MEGTTGVKNQTTERNTDIEKKSGMSKDETKEKNPSTATELLRNILASKSKFRESKDKDTEQEMTLQLVNVTKSSAKKEALESKTIVKEVKQLKRMVNKVEILDGRYIKFEDKDKQYKPVVCKELSLPIINYLNQGPAFVSPPKPLPKESRDNTQFQLDSNFKDATKKENGYCEICAVHFEDLEIHRSTEQHTSYISDGTNYASLDRVISNVNKRNENEITENCTIKGISMFNAELIETVISRGYVKGTIEGNEDCWRHLAFANGGKTQKDLDDTKLLELVPEEIMSMIEKQIRQSLGEHYENGYIRDYIIKVLLPDAIICLFSTVMKWTKAKTEEHFKAYLTHIDENNDITVKDDETFQQHIKRGMVNHQNFIKELHSKIQNKRSQIDFKVTNEAAEATKVSDAEIESAKKVSLQSTEANATNTKGQPKKRKSGSIVKECPVCNISQKYITRHLRRAHKWSWESAAAASSQFGLKNSQKKELEKKSSNYHYSRMCPFPNCFLVRSNLPDHLARFHKMEKGPKFYEMLKIAPKFEESYLPKDFSQSPKKSFQDILVKKTGEAASSNDNVNISQNRKRRFEYSSRPNSLESTAVPKETKKTVFVHGDDQEKLGNEESSCIIESMHQSSNVNEFCQLRLRPKVRYEMPANEQVAESDDSTEDESNIGGEDLGESSGDDDCYDQALGKNVEKLVERFREYMIGPDRKRDEASMYVIAGDVRRIFRAINVKDDVSIVFKNGGNDFREKYFNQYCKQKKTKATSVKKYLYSLIDLCEFLIAEDVALPNVSRHDITTMIGKLKQWRKNFRKEEKLARFERMSEDQEMLVTKDQVLKYTNSDQARKSTEIIQKLAQYGAYPVSQTDYCMVRDHIYFTIHFTLAQRSGVTANMTMNEFLKAKKIDGVWIIDVWNHKTVETYGPAKVILSEDNFNILKTYIDFARIQTNPRCNEVFLSWSGRKVKSGDISKRLHLLWERVGNFENKIIPKNLSSNIVRKSASTGLRESKSAHIDDAANLMAHSIKTADQHYYLRNIEKSSLIGTSSVTNLFHGTDDINKTPTKKKTWTEKECEVLKHTFDEENEISLSEVKKKSDSLSSLNASPRQMYDKLRRMSKPAFSPIKRRSLFSNEDIKKLKHYGVKLIEGGALTEERVRDCLKECNLMENFSFTQIRTRIMYERRKRR